MLIVYYSPYGCTAPHAFERSTCDQPTDDQQVTTDDIGNFVFFSARLSI